MSTFLYGAHVHANGIRQHYLRYGGHGPALILIPGITSPAITGLRRRAAGRKIRRLRTRRARPRFVVQRPGTGL